MSEPIPLRKSLAIVERELELAKKRHPTSFEEDDPHPVKDQHGHGWKRIWHNVILFDRPKAS
jgi:hypothetical protein